MRYFMRLGYRGAGFHGWQVQPHDPSVQQTIEEAMATLLRVPTPITGAGRTDAGVNARLMVAHFDTEQPIDDVQRLVPASMPQAAPTSTLLYPARIRSVIHSVGNAPLALISN